MPLSHKHHCWPPRTFELYFQHGGKMNTFRIWPLSLEPYSFSYNRAVVVNSSKMKCKQRASWCGLFRMSGGWKRISHCAASQISGADFGGSGLLISIYRALIVCLFVPTFSSVRFSCFCVVAPLWMAALCEINTSFLNNLQSESSPEKRSARENCDDQ